MKKLMTISKSKFFMLKVNHPSLAEMIDETLTDLDREVDDKNVSDDTTPAAHSNVDPFSKDVQPQQMKSANLNLGDLLDSNEDR